MSGIPPFFIPGVTPPNPWANAAMMAQAQQQAQQAQMAAAVQMQAQATAAAQLQAAQIHAVQAAHAQVQAQVQATQGWNSLKNLKNSRYLNIYLFHGRSPSNNQFKTRANDRRKDARQSTKMAAITD